MVVTLDTHKELNQCIVEWVYVFIDPNEFGIKLVAKPKEEEGSAMDALKYITFLF